MENIVARIVLSLSLLTIVACGENNHGGIGTSPSACVLSNGSLAECVIYAMCEQHAACAGEEATAACVERFLVPMCEMAVDGFCQAPVPAGVTAEHVEACVDAVYAAQCDGTYVHPPECEGVF